MAVKALKIKNVESLLEEINLATKNGIIDPRKIADYIWNKYNVNFTDICTDEELIAMIRGRINELYRAQRSSERREANSPSPGASTPRLVAFEDYPWSDPVKVPGVGWITVAECTANDCLLVSEDYKSQAFNLKREANIWQKRRKLMLDNNVKTLGELRKLNIELPV